MVLRDLRCAVSSDEASSLELPPRESTGLPSDLTPSEQNLPIKSKDLVKSACLWSWRF